MVSAVTPCDAAKELLNRRYARAGLLGYIRKVFDYDPPPHQLPWIETLDNPSILRSNTIAPPKYGKTPTMQDYVTKLIGDNPAIHILYISNTASQAIKPSLAIRNTIEFNIEYRALYPNVIPDKNTGWANSAWYVKRPNFADKDPTFQAAGVHGPVLGATVDVIILDDVADQENMATEYQRDKLMEWLRGTVMSRLVPGGIARNIATRWHDADPAALWEEDGWHTTVLPARNEQGELTYPAFWTTEALATRRVDLGPRLYELMFQQQVIPEEDQIFKHEYWRYYELGLPGRIRTVVQSWDTAFGEKDRLTTARSVCETWAICDDGYYLLDIWTGRPAYPQLKKEVEDQHKTHQASVVLIEDMASGKSLLEDLRLTTRVPAVGIIPTKDKVARANAITGMLEAGKVKIPKQAKWRQEWEFEHESFPYAKLKDLVDTTTQFLQWARKNTAKVSRPSGGTAPSRWAD